MKNKNIITFCLQAKQKEKIYRIYTSFLINKKTDQIQFLNFGIINTTKNDEKLEGHAYHDIAYFEQTFRLWIEKTQPGLLTSIFDMISQTCFITNRWRFSEIITTMALSKNCLVPKYLVLPYDKNFELITKLPNNKAPSKEICVETKLKFANFIYKYKRGNMTAKQLHLYCFTLFFAYIKKIWGQTATNNSIEVHEKSVEKKNNILTKKEKVKLVPIERHIEQLEKELELGLINLKKKQALVTKLRAETMAYTNKYPFNAVLTLGEYKGMTLYEAIQKDGDKAFNFIKRVAQGSIQKACLAITKTAFYKKAKNKNNKVF